MIPSETNLLTRCGLTALALSLALTPLMRWLALRFNILDRPITQVKTHRAPVPYLGGVAISIALVVSLVAARFLTNFPTGTLHDLRGILVGGILILLLGLVDDITPKGLSYRWKFVVQTVAAVCVMSFNVRIHFVQPWWLSEVITLLWFVAVMNAVNIVDIMDGLASGIAVIACLGFLFISLPSEQIYVNFLSAASAGAILGFMPYNLSRRFKIFMGDAGSLMVGFLLAALSVGTSYTRVNNLAVFAPILILWLPLFDITLVSILRLRKGMSPFLGSKDHYALRLEKFGFLRQEILGISYASAVLLTFLAYQVTRLPFEYTLFVYGLVLVGALGTGLWLSTIDIE
jgi:UDP-GlcNAc:undecaprenyl-phosphate GlcNAc-1-phosphate transferase